MKIVRAEMSFCDVKPGCVFEQIGPHAVSKVFMRLDTPANSAVSMRSGITCNFNPPDQIVRVLNMKLVEQYGMPENDDVAT